MSKLSEQKRQIQLMIQKADRSLDVACQNKDGGNYDFASSRAYYAAFYVIQAVLLTKNLSFSKHSAVISMFNQYFVKTGTFPSDFGKLISQLFRERQIGDYDFEVIITEDDAQKDIEAAERVAEAVRTYLVKEAFL